MTNQTTTTKYATTVLVKSQGEIRKRFQESLQSNAANRNTERQEYLRVMSYHTALSLGVNDDVTKQSDWAKDTIIEIDYSAKALLRLWHNQILTGSLTQSKRYTEMYVAFKWILGHADSDSFPGAFDLTHGGPLNLDSFNYIKEQLVTGEWDGLTAAAVAAKRGEL